MRSLFTRLLLLTAFLTAGSAAFAAGVFTARLSGTQEVPPAGTAATGSAACTIESGALLVYVTASGLSGPITAAHIHSGAPGVAGGVVRDLAVVGNSMQVTWRVSDPQPLTAALLEELHKGNLYVNVHTAANPAGEIRGQLELAHGAHFLANFSGNQENPPVATAGLGTGSATWTEDGLSYKITLSNLTGPISAAHIHGGEIGVNGGVLVNLTGSFTGNSAIGFIPRSSFTAAQIAELFAGRLYFNAHTAAFPGGEVRGQILLNGGFGFGASLSGANEVPANASAATASGSFTLTPSGLQFDITATGVNITNAHFHNAAAGVNGPAVRGILADFAGGTTASGIWRFDDSEPLTTALLAELLAGRIYVNLHSAAFPGGEIRSQVVLSDATIGTVFTARLTGAQEEPGTGATGRGTGTFRLSAGGLDYRITVDGLTGGISASHFHAAGIGQNGGVLFNITPTFAGNTATGTWALGAADVTQLLLGNLYVNIHTVAFPGGEIRGQVLAASGVSLDARMTGSQEVPAIAGAGQGTGAFRLTRDGLTFHFTTDGTSGPPTAQHFHGAARGVNGGVVRGIAAAELTGTTGGGVWKPTDPSPLSPALVLDLLRHRIYLNTHTAANPGGEIRGQVVVSGGHGQNAPLVGDSEIPPVLTDGKGIMGGTLTDMGLIFRTTINDLIGTLTASHFHNAPPTANGPVVRDLTAEFTAGTADGVWMRNDAQPLTAALLGEMLQGNIYKNVHTTAFGGGEIRGNFRRSGTTAVDDGPPAATLQLSNFPNPVLDRTVLSFFLPAATDVSLKVFDISGREVATVMNGRSAAGRHTAVFDAGKLSNGIYLYKLQAGDQTSTRKMLVVR